MVLWRRPPSRSRVLRCAATVRKEQAGHATWTQKLDRAGKRPRLSHGRSRRRAGQVRRQARGQHGRHAREAPGRQEGGGGRGAPAHGGRGQGVLARLQRVPERHGHALRPAAEAPRYVRLVVRDDDRRAGHQHPSAVPGPRARSRRDPDLVPAALPEGPAAQEGREALPGREQSTGARELRARPWHSAREVALEVGGDRTMLTSRLAAGLLALALVVTPPMTVRTALAASAAEINRDANSALAKLYQTHPDTKKLGAQAKGILVFPTIYKAGFMFGAQYGEGALRKGNKTAGYYNTVAASYGLQAGAQAFGYALFFMNDAALAYLDKTEGFEIGSGPSVVVLDEGMGKTMTSTTLTQDVYAVIFNQKGLMGGLGLQGSKISKIQK